MLYTVKPGDTLSKLAIQFYGDMNRWREIQQVNNIVNPDLISIGQQLRIPNLSVSDEYLYPTNITTPLPPTPAGFTRNEHGELVIPITGGATVPTPSPATLQPTTAAMFGNPLLWLAAGMIALLIGRKPRRRSRSRPRTKARRPRR